MRERTCGIVFTLDPIQQCIVVCRAGRNLIQCIQGLNDIVELALWKAEAQIARDRM